MTGIDKGTKISITGKVGYEDDITTAQAAKIIGYLNADEGEGASLAPDHDSVGSNGGQSSKAGGEPAGKLQSAREALGRSGAKTIPEKMVALGAYLHSKGSETFKADDLRAEFQRARETTPSHFARDLTKAVKAGWIAEASNSSFFVTSKAQGVFDEGFRFPKIPRGAAKARITGKAGKGKPEKPAVFAHVDEFPTKMEGFPPYSKMKAQKDKLLWALQFGVANGTNGLSNKDVTWLTDHLGAGIPNASVTSAFLLAQAPGYANRSTQDRTLRITDDGVAYLKTVGTEAS
jgi:hypothetical protein